MMGAVSASNRTLAMMSNRRLAKPESRRPEENPSEKMNQLGLTLSRSTRPVSRSRKLERSLTCTPVVLIRRRSDNGSALRRSSRASTTSLAPRRSEEHTSELQSLMRISYAVFCLKKKKKQLQSKITSTIHRQHNKI